MPGFCSEGKQYSFLEWLLFETEQVHGKIRRYTSPDEHPFFPKDLPPLVLAPLEYPSVLAPFSDEINYNPAIMRMYIEEVIPAITEPGSDNNHGSSCLIDVTLLQVGPAPPDPRNLAAIMQARRCGAGRMAGAGKAGCGCRGCVQRDSRP